MMDGDPARASAARTPSPETEGELAALLGVVRGLRALAEGRLAGLAIAPGEYLADIYSIQRVAALLAMELSAAGRSLRRPEVQAAGDEVHAIEGLLAAALERRGVSLEDCVIDAAEAKMTRRGGSPV